ncbi:MAG: hypothetical protein O6945_14355, partial [Gammaproteobacteria bacterium]|nr:hypothetical protein [Gammaproteobacteria bacterium]
MSVVRFHLWPPFTFADSAAFSDFQDPKGNFYWAEKSENSDGPPLGPRNLHERKIDDRYQFSTCFGWKLGKRNHTGDTAVFQVQDCSRFENNETDPKYHGIDGMPVFEGQ